MEERTSYEEKLARILKAAVSVFAEKGFHRASIREIAATTGISLSGLYYYFKSKDELLFLIQDHCLGTILDRLDDELAGIEDPEARLRIVIRTHLRFFVGNMEEMKVLSHEGESLHAEYRERIRAKKRRYTGLVRETLAGLLPPEGELDVRIATFSLFGMLNWIYTWYRPGRDVDVEGLADDMTHLFLHGVLAARPREPGERGAGREGEEEAAGVTSMWPGP